MRHERAPASAHHEAKTASAPLDPLATPLAELLALVPHGVLLIGKRRKVLYANPRAIHCIQAAKGISIEAGRFCKDDPVRAARLGRVLDRARRLAPGTIAGTWLVPRATGLDQPLTIVVTAQSLEGSHGYPAVAAIHLVDPESDCGVPSTFLQQLYGLTRREACLATVLTQRQSLRAAAAELGISIGTARNHLKRVFLKTSTRSQAHLMRLLLLTATAFRFEIGGWARPPATVTDENRSSPAPAR